MTEPSAEADDRYLRGFWAGIAANHKANCEPSAEAFPCCTDLPFLSRPATPPLDVELRAVLDEARAVDRFQRHPYLHAALAAYDAAALATTEQRECVDCGGDHPSGHPWHTPPTTEQREGLDVATLRALQPPKRYENDVNGNWWTTDMEYGWDCAIEAVAALANPDPETEG